MEKHAEDARRKAMVIDIDMLVPKDHLLRKIEKVMDYDWLYERLNPLYNDKVGRPGTDPVVLIKMVLIQHLFGIPSLRQTWRECDVNVAYRWFLGYDLLEHIPHFATVSYAFCNRFPAELSVEIFDHILNKALNNRMVDPSVVFIDGTHIKASANKKKFQKEQVNKAAKVYDEVLRKEVNEERAKLGKKEIEDKDDDEPPKGEKTVSTTDPDCGMFVKGEHERQFAYEAHTACERHGFVLAVEVTPGNIHDSVAWDAVYDSVCSRFPEAEALYFLRRKVGDVAVEIERLPRVGAGKPRRGQSAGGKHAATKVFVPLKGTVVGKPGSGSAHAGQPAEGTPLIGHRVNVGGPVAQDRHGKPRTVPQVRRGHAVLSAFPQNIGPYACQLCHGADPLQDLLLGQFGFQSLFSFL